MITAFKLLYANRSGSLVHISEVERGLACGCSCPACGEGLVARQGEKRQPHFAHQSGSACNPETQLHAVAKRILFDRISIALERNQVLPITWSCELCNSGHAGNLLKRASRVEVERTIGLCRPDLSLFDASDHVVAFLEVVVTHEPKAAVRWHASEIGARVIEFRVCDANDLESLRQQEPLKVSRLDLCTRNKCPLCGRPLSEQTLHVVEGDCWKCRRPMRIALVDIEGMMSGPEVLSRDGIRIAQSMGAHLRQNFSNVIGKRYLSNTCGGCGRMTGDFYLKDFWYKASSATGVPLGAGCTECGWTRSS